MAFKALPVSRAWARGVQDPTAAGGWAGEGGGECAVASAHGEGAAGAPTASGSREQPC